MPLFTTRVYVTLKPSVFDPQGRTIVESLHSLGYGGVAHVRQGKYFEVQVEAADAAAAEATVREVSGTLLANPVIESFRVDTPTPVA
ncbi:phosphoribosylformylglycinamidine synthase subunit PurS [Luteitalea sp.]|jgi:phosphoribosylformylglycinamidine synthase PurS subunit|uniref:phosphoribosylformylglycinamidine synthase subunit PurS n=1 Tax=Luteitalea sp. TaxID=2004800 RepID=UPI0037C7B7A0